MLMTWKHEKEYCYSSIFWCVCMQICMYTSEVAHKLMQVQEEPKGERKKGEGKIM